MRGFSFLPSVMLLLAPRLVVAQHEHHHETPAQPVATTPKTSDQHAEAQAEAAMSAPDANAMKHLKLTPLRAGTPADSARARALVDTLRRVLAPYKDVKRAERDGYEMFAPQLRTQRVYHFTRRGSAIKAVFTFDPANPTSLLYTKDAAGNFNLVGAMYTANRRVDDDELDLRVPLSIARWHRHVNICVPRLRQRERWLETVNGTPKFGPAGVIATEKDCKAADGRWLDHIFGWMVHANVFASDDPAVIWGDHHDHGAGHSH